MIKSNGSAPTDDSSRRVTPDYFSRYVRRTFHRTLRGYSTDEVDEHLRQIRGWFTLSGFDRLVEQRREELLGSAMREAEATRVQARRESEAILEEARREAEATLERARRESQAILNEATRRAEATTAAAQRRLASLKSLASGILEEDLDAAS